MSVPVDLAFRSCGGIRGNGFSPLACDPATTPAAASDLISFLKALPDCRTRPGVRFLHWWMLLVAILSILRSQGSLVRMGRFAGQNRQAL